LGWKNEIEKSGFYHIPPAGHDVQLAGHDVIFFSLLARG
jgi:hypothetical protein